MSKGIEGMTGDGSDYTGYWVTDMNTPNEHFGTADDLKALSAELHKRGMNTAFLCDLSRRRVSVYGSRLQLLRWFIYLGSLLCSLFVFRVYFYFFVCQD